MNPRLTQTPRNFIDRDYLYELSVRPEPDTAELDGILNKALELKGLSLKDVSALLQVKKHDSMQKLFRAANKVKQEIYGNRLVLFAPLYIGNICSNNCIYCAFRSDNKSIKRLNLTLPQIEEEVKSLLRQGHKRILMLCGETEDLPLDYFVSSIRTAYAAREDKAYVRRVNIEIAPQETEGFAKLKSEKIGTYVCFQETYDEVLYKKYHPSGKKADYLWRLSVMDRAMEGGIDDVGIGALLGLADYRFEVLSMMEHASHLEKTFGCGPHTVSVPRIEYAEGVPFTKHIPHAVSDDDFKKIVAVIRMALPYTGIILSTRENEEVRTELFHYGISQISAGSRTNPGAYAGEKSSDTGSQFSLGDHRSLDEVISSLIDDGYVPSFCTGCYRKGRVGHDFMDLAKPGLIKEFCFPNAVFTFKEYLNDYASPATRVKGLKLIDKLTHGIENQALKEKMTGVLEKIDSGERDIYF
ncbi:MAG: [FeFe] hydrogenase H-cluster radical SAM maturase HydG [Brevinematales bacterium]